MEFNLDETLERYTMIAQAFGAPSGGVPSRPNAEASIRALIKLKGEIGLTDKLGDFGVPNDPEDLSALVELAAGDSQMTYNPRMLDDTDILKLFLKAF